MIFYSCLIATVVVTEKLTGDQWVRLPACSFLLVFHSYHVPKTHRFLSSLGALDETDGRTDGRIAASLNVIYTFGSGGHSNINCYFVSSVSFELN